MRRHPVNALLNYGYAVLESQVCIAIAEVGLDPSIGYLHVCLPGRQALVYDLMEPYRPEVDRDVLGFVRSNTFTPKDSVIDAKGVCRLHPELARQEADSVGLQPLVFTSETRDYVRQLRGITYVAPPQEIVGIVQSLEPKTGVARVETTDGKSTRVLLDAEGFRLLRYDTEAHDQLRFRGNPIVRLGSHGLPFNELEALSVEVVGSQSDAD